MGAVTQDSERIGSTTSELSGAAGIASFPAAAKAANNVSLAEVVRYIQENLLGEVEAATTDSINGKVGTDTEMADRSLFDILAGDGYKTFPVAAAAANDKTLGAVVRYIQETVLGSADGTTTDSINGKLGTDTELADRSLFDLLVGGGPASFPVAAAAANDKCIAAVVRYIQETQIGGIDAVTTDCLNGKLGTDTELADRSLFDVLASGGPAAFPVSAAPANDVSLAAVLRKVYDQTAVGYTFWVKKTLTSSAVTQAGVDITGVSSVGELAIEDIVVKTNGTGLATGTNFVICSDNANGLANIFVETVANLGANKTMDLTGASVTKIRTVLETGKKLTAKSTVADCDGAGTIDIYIKFRALTAGATIAAA